MVTFVKRAVQAHIHTHTDTDKQTHRYRQTDTQKQTNTYTQIHIDTDTETQTQTDTQTHKVNIHTGIRDRQMDRFTHTLTTCQECCLIGASVLAPLRAVTAHSIAY